MGDCADLLRTTQPHLSVTSCLARPGFRVCSQIVGWVGFTRDGEDGKVVQTTTTTATRFLCGGKKKKGGQEVKGF